MSKPRNPAYLEALASGAKTYLTGKPCKRGHIAPRYTINCQCVECSKLKDLEARADPERYARIKAKKRERYAENPERRQKERPGYMKEYYWKNRDKSLEVSKAWRKANPEKVCDIAARRRANKLSATPSWLTDQHKLEIEQKYFLAKLHESVTGIKWHVDHIVPLKGRKVCGLHVPWNLQVIPASVNIAKSNKHE